MNILFHQSQLAGHPLVNIDIESGPFMFDLPIKHGDFP